MKRIPVALVLTIFLLALGPALAVHDCPDTQATNIGPTLIDGPGGEKCKMGFALFGQDLALGGEFCPSMRFLTPAHQECLGAPLVGSECAIAGNRPVTAMDCECDTLGGAILSILLGSCECEDNGLDVGHVEDAHTLPCPRDL
jgi:hypothetical protein